LFRKACHDPVGRVIGAVSIASRMVSIGRGSGWGQPGDVDAFRRLRKLRHQQPNLHRAFVKDAAGR
jgi:hypothetical protein